MSNAVISSQPQIAYIYLSLDTISGMPNREWDVQMLHSPITLPPSVPPQPPIVLYNITLYPMLTSDSLAMLDAFLNKTY